MIRDHWRPLLLATLLIGAASWLFFTWFHLVDKEVSFGYSPDARLNDYLAAQRFLNHMGIPTNTLPSPTPQSQLPPTDEVLMLTTKRLTVDAATRRALLDWVHAGGHLILSARTDTVTDGLGDLLDKRNEIEADDDPLLAELGVTLKVLDMDEDEADEYGAFAVDFAAADDYVWVDFDPLYRLSNDDPRLQELAGDQLGAVVLSGGIGAGRVSIIADRKPLHNRRIGDQQHARFLWYLVTLHGPAVGVHIVIEDDMPALLIWLWGHARELMISLLLIALLALWAVSRRFGPLRGLAPPVRRSMVEHIRASGGFQWRHHYHDALLRGVREDVQQQMVLKHPTTQGLTPTAAASYLTDIVELPEQDIRRALTPAASHNTKKPNARQFTATVRLLTELRKRL